MSVKQQFVSKNFGLLESAALVEYTYNQHSSYLALEMFWKTQYMDLNYIAEFEGQEAEKIWTQDLL